LVAPFLSSFLDAAAVTIVRGELYWSVWQARFFSNALTGLMLVPAIVLGVTAGPAWLRRAPGARRAGAALLTVARVLVGGWGFGPRRRPSSEVRAGRASARAARERGLEVGDPELSEPRGRRSGT